MTRNPFPSNPLKAIGTAWRWALSVLGVLAAVSVILALLLGDYAAAIARAVTDAVYTGIAAAMATAIVGAAAFLRPFQKFIADVVELFLPRR